MGTRMLGVLLWLILVYPSVTEDQSELDSEASIEDKWVMLKQSARKEENKKHCAEVHPNARDIVKRFYAIVPYLDREHSNTAFLHKFRGTVYGMSQGEDLLDREAAYYGTVLTPVVFLRQYKDTWCLLERFHRALRLYQISHPTEKRSALKLLQNLRAVNHKVHTFILNLPGPAPRRTSPPQASESEDEELHDRKDIKYIKELIKSLG